MNCPHCKGEHPDGTVRCPETGRDITVVVTPPGRILGGKYELVRLIGEGGMGSVYEARHVEIRQRVAIKILHAEFARDEEIRKRFVREALASGEIGHENIVEMHDIGTDEGGRVYLVMELLRGESLAARIARLGALPVDQAADVLTQVLGALDASHAKGIVHRDMKPENVFLCRLGAMDCFVKVLDFGIAKVKDAGGETLTRSGAILGTGQYMSPEQIMGDRAADHRMDVYACGVMLYRMVTGHVPFEAPSMQAVIYKTLHVAPPPMGSWKPGLPAGIEDVVARAIAKDRGARYQSAADMARAIAPFGSGRVEFGRSSRIPEAEGRATDESVVDGRQASVPVGDGAGGSIGPAGAPEPARAAHASPPRSGSHRSPAREGPRALAVLALLPSIAVGLPAVVVAVVIAALGHAGTGISGGEAAPEGTVTAAPPSAEPPPLVTGEVAPATPADAGVAEAISGDATADPPSPAEAAPPKAGKEYGKKLPCDPRKNPKCARIKGG